MFSTILESLKANLVLISAACAALVFVIWGARKMRLEIAKLEHEIKNLKKETLIYRPSHAEIQDVLQKSKRLPTRRASVTGAADPVGEFCEQFQVFILSMAAHYGDADSKVAVARFALEAACRGTSSRFPPTANGLPDPNDLVALWKSVRVLAQDQLDNQQIEMIDTFLRRFASYHVPHDRPLNVDAGETRFPRAS